MVLVCCNGVLEKDFYKGDEGVLSTVVLLIKKWQMRECRDIWKEVRREDIM